MCCPRSILPRVFSDLFFLPFTVSCTPDRPQKDQVFSTRLSTSFPFDLYSRNLLTTTPAFTPLLINVSSETIEQLDYNESSRTLAELYMSPTNTKRSACAAPCRVGILDRSYLDEAPVKYNMPDMNLRGKYSTAFVMTRRTHDSTVGPCNSTPGLLYCDIFCLAPVFRHQLRNYFYELWIPASCVFS